MLKSSDFSVVVQGPLHSSPDRKGERDITIRCLASSRAFLPGAEIILSTWNGENTDGLDCDILVKSDDPGAALIHATGIPPVSNNTNRQIVSTRAGLAAATRPYAVKFRGDLAWESDSILQYGDLLAAPLLHGLFHSRVLLTPSYTKNPRRSLYAFHFSDILQIGRTEDLRKIWSVPLAPEPETTLWLEGRTTVLFEPLWGCYLRVRPEQYVMLGLINASGRRVWLNHPKDISPAKLMLSEKMLIDNFQVLEPAQLGVRFPDRFVSRPSDLVYQAADWDRLSRAYRRWPVRWRVQAGLLVQAYWTVVDLFFRSLFGGSFFQNLGPYRWLRDRYRRFFPLP